MFGVRGGRRPAAAAFPLAVRRGSAAEGAQKQLPGTAVTGLMTARVTAVMDPASFWAQVGKGRRSAPTYVCVLVCVRACSKRRIFVSVRSVFGSPLLPNQASLQLLQLKTARSKLPYTSKRAATSTLEWFCTKHLRNSHAWCSLPQMYYWCCCCVQV